MDYRNKIRLLTAIPRPLRRALVTSRFRREIEFSGEPELAYLRDLVQPGDLSLDIGCNLGVYAYELGRLTGNVIAFEPNPVLADFVRGLRLSGLREVRPVALSSEPGTASLTVPAYRGGHQAASLRDIGSGAGMARINVPVQRLDDLDLTGVKFIKIDVEGMEEGVLDGAAALIERDRPTLLIEIEERHNAGGLHRIEERLRAFGYSAFYIAGGDWVPLSQFSLERDQPTTEHFRSALRDKPRRSVPYTNNFLFKCDGGEATVPATASSVFA